MTFADLLHQHAALALEKQFYLAELTEGSSWAFSMPTGELSFGNGLRSQVQILGTEGEAAGTWLWAWANQASGIPAQLLEAAEAMRALGHQETILELTTAEQELSEAIMAACSP